MTGEAKSTVVHSVISELNAHYVFVEMAERVGTELQAHLRSGNYADVQNAVALADRITTDIHAISRDKHIRLRYNADPASPPDGDGKSDQAECEYRSRCLESNFGVERVERLPLNIGYIELRGFMRTDLAGDAITAAMALVVNTEALIFDLRRNGGGYPTTVALISSYLFDERKHLNSFYLREGEKTEQFWTHPWVPGKKFGEAKPVYVLVSSSTFSAAEEFTYNLKHLKRGTIVGETTRGGAHPGEFRWLTPHFSLFVPGGRAINPITQTNWEGVGVEPDVKAPAADALRVAQLLALEQIASRPQSSPRRSEIADRVRELEADSAAQAEARLQSL